MAGTLFISYAREDQAFVHRLVDGLSAAGTQTWVDWEGIEPSDRWLQSVHEAIESADAVVPVISPNLIASSACRGEIEYAGVLHKRLIPIVIGDVPDETQIPEALTEVNWIFIRPGESLEEGIQQLLHAVDLDLDLIRIHTRVLTRAQAWDLGGRRATPLLRGEELEQAEGWLARAASGKEPQPTNLQSSFVRASRREASKRHRRALAASLIVTAIASALAVFALIQRNDAIHNEAQSASRELAARSEQQLGGDPQLALILALHGYDRSPTPESESAIRAAVRASTVRAYLGGLGESTAIEYDPSGQYVLSVESPPGQEAGTEVRVWAWRSGGEPSQKRRLWVLPDRLAVSARFASDPRVVDVLQQDGTYLAWRWASAQRPRVLGTLSPVFAKALVDLSPDGKRVAGSGAVGIILGQLPPSDVPPTVLPGTAGFDRVQFSPDGTLIATFNGGPLVQVWNTATGNLIDTFDLSKNGSFASSNGAAFDPSDSRLAVAEVAGATDTFVAVYSLRNPAALPDIKQVVTPPGLPAPCCHLAMEPASLAWNGTGTALAAGWLDDTRVWWESDPSPIYLNGGDPSNQQVTFSPNGTFVATSGGPDEVWDWQASRAAVLAAAPNGTKIQTNVLLSPDNRTVAVAVDDLTCTGTTELWDWRASSAVTIGQGCPIAFSRDNRYLALETELPSSGPNEEGVLSVWNLATRTQVASSNVTGFLVGAEFLLQDDSLAFLTSSPNNVGEWNWLHGLKPAIVGLGSGPPTGGQLLAGAVALVAGPGTHGQLEYLNGRSLYRWDGVLTHSPVLVSGRAVTIPRGLVRSDSEVLGYSEAALLDSRRLVVALSLCVACGSGVTIVSDIKDGTSYQLLPGASTVVFTVSSSNNELAVTGTTGRLLLWDEHQGDQAVYVATTLGAVPSMDAQGEYLATTSGSGVEVIPIDESVNLDRLLALARSRVARALSPAEQNTYLSAL